MPIEEASDFFEAIPAIHRHLKTLVDVGLGYVRLGQPAPTLSGGEAQRVKLASELQKRSTGRTVYVLDEPTTGLHFEDIRKLLKVLEGLVDKGNTVIVIEHNLDVIKTADWLIDMGPEGGHRGGTVVAVGSPEELAETPESYTGQFLRQVMGMSGKPAGSDEAVERARRANGGTAKSASKSAPARATAAKSPPAKAASTRAAAKTAMSRAASTNGVAGNGAAGSAAAKTAQTKTAQTKTAQSKTGQASGRASAKSASPRKAAARRS
jgi:excinuclease ABC subunit A